MNTAPQDSTASMHSAPTPPASRTELDRRGSSSGDPAEGGRVLPSAGEAVPFSAERLDLRARREFGSVEAALGWCGLDLAWVHVQARIGQSMMIGTKSDRPVAVIRGPLLAILPECVEMAVIR